MVAPLTSTELREAFEYWKVPVIYEPGYASRSNGNPWGDLTMLVMHHTGDDLPDAVSAKMLRDGRPGLGGPLCQFAPQDDGVLRVIALGPANHAGGGDPKVLAAVRAESYGDYPPPSTKTHGESGSVGGNSIAYGWESMYAGPKDPTINPLQYRVAVLSMAAVTWALDKKDTKNTWTAKSTVGHKEWQKYKPDPAGIDMKVQRADIQWCLDNGPVAARGWYDTGKKGTNVSTAEDTATATWKREVYSIPEGKKIGVGKHVQDMGNVVFATAKDIAGIKDTLAREVAKQEAFRQAMLAFVANGGDAEAISADVIRAKVEEALEGMKVSFDVSPPSVEVPPGESIAD